MKFWVQFPAAPLIFAIALGKVEVFHPRSTMSRHAGSFDVSYEKKRIEIAWEGGFEDVKDTLACPHCSGHNLHHYGFTDYERGEDAKTVEIVDCGSVLFDDKGERHSVYGRINCHSFTGGALQVFSDLQGDRNPSARRHGIVIKFWCENCSNISLLCIDQHKGISQIGWRAVKVTPSKDLEKKKRKTIKPKLRFDILERDNHTCQACGATPHDGATLEIDHIQPFSKGGTDEPNNLQVLCRECNAGKGAR
jgi:5-methylcytosine-specific restriction endonuclease McrA